MPITLHVIAGPHTGQSFTFNRHETFVVGRSTRAHFRLEPGTEADLRVSRTHFLIEVNPPLCRLIDLGSRNGTYLNGERVKSGELKNGDEIRAGHTTFRVDCPEEPTEDWSKTFEPVAAEGPALPPVPQKLEPRKRRDGYCLACPTPLKESGGPFCQGCLTLAGQTEQPIPGYLIVGELGRGGMGVVYLARRESDGAAVAVKTIRPAVVMEPKHVERFLREANILRELRHPYIVAFHDMGEAKGVLFFAMEHVAGPSAAELLKRKGPLPVRSAVRLINEVLLALAYAHDMGFVHRDIKPHNLLVEDTLERKTVKVADFGLARFYAASHISGLTMRTEQGGTYGFMPPEQLTSFREAKPPADQFAAAATLYHLLTGKLIHDLEREPSRMLSKILNDEPVPILSRRADLPADLAEVIHRALRREPEDRFPDVRAFREALLPFGR